MIFPKNPFNSIYTTAGNKVKYIRNIELIDAIQHLEMHLATAICGNASIDFQKGIKLSIAILSQLNKPIEFDNEDD